MTCSKLPARFPLGSSVSSSCDDSARTLIKIEDTNVSTMRRPLTINLFFERVADRLIHLDIQNYKCIALDRNQREVRLQHPSNLVLELIQTVIRVDFIKHREVVRKENNLQRLTHELLAQLLCKFIALVFYL